MIGETTRSNCNPKLQLQAALKEYRKIAIQLRCVLGAVTFLVSECQEWADIRKPQTRAMFSH